MFGSKTGSAGRTWFGKPGPVVRVAAGVELVVLLGQHAEGEPDQLPLLGQVRPTEQLAAQEMRGHCVATQAEVAFWHQAAGACVCALIFHSPNKALECWFLETFEHGCGHVPSVILSLALLFISALQLPEFLHKVAPSASKHEHVC